MGGTTPLYGLPYPTGTDRVADGDNAIEALARATETKLRMAGDSVFCSDSAIATYNISFPAGRFTSPPMVVTGVGAGANVPMVAYVGNVTATDATIYVAGVGGGWASGTFSVYWLAFAPILTATTQPGDPNQPETRPS